MGENNRCESDSDCPEGKVCKNGQCVDKGGGGGSPCSGDGYKGKNVKGTDGKWHLLTPCKTGYKPVKDSEGVWWCCKVTEPPGKECETNDDCPEGKVCKNGRCVDPGSEGCEGGYVMESGTSRCREGFKPRKINGVMWCCPEGNNDNDDDDDGGNGEIGGEFQWSERLQDLLSMLGDRIKYLFEYPRGLTPEERQAIINYAVEGVKRSTRPQLQSKRDQLARMGLLGSGFEASELDKIRRGANEMIANVKRQVAIDELDRRFRELMGTTGMAQGLLGTMMESERLPEILSAGRRAESQGAFNALLNYLGSASSMAGSMMPSYLNAILNQAQNYPSSTSGFGAWLPWLGWLLGNQFGSGAKTITSSAAGYP